MRRSELLLLLMLLGTLPLRALDIRLLAAEYADGGYGIACALIGVDRERLLEALDNGDTVEVLLRIRDDAPAGFLPEERDSSRTMRRRARWDAIEKLYVIESGGRHRYFPHKDAFLAELLAFDEIVIPAAGPEVEYALQGEIAWRLLNPPLNILTPFLPGLRSTTAWHTIPATGRGVGK